MRPTDLYPCEVPDHDERFRPLVCAKYWTSTAQAVHDERWLIGLKTQQLACPKAALAVVGLRARNAIDVRRNVAAEI